MLKLYRRHYPACKHSSKGTSYTKCACPIWVDGMHEGKRTRYSLDTFNPSSRVSGMTLRH
jgi:hypothetical protein